MLTDLRAAVLRLSDIPDTTPVEFSLGWGSPSVIAYDPTANIVRVRVGSGTPQGRPTLGQMRSWLGLPAVAGQLAGFWNSLRGFEPMNLRGALTFASAVFSGYHGIRRHDDSIGWGLIWFAAGAWLPGFVPLVAVAQGYGEPLRTCKKE